MAIKTMNEKMEEIQKDLEEKQLDFLKRRKEFLDKELELKKQLGFKRTEPEFEYENEPDWLDHMKESFAYSIEQEQLRIDNEIANIEVTQLQREESKKYQKKGEF